MRMSMRAILAVATFPLFAAPMAQADEALTSPALVVIDVPMLPLAPDEAVVADEADAFGPVVAGDALDDLRGGADNQTDITNISDVDGTVDGNTAINSITGGNLVDGGAFTNAAGLSTVIQNSGNNVLIQNSTVVSVLFTPVPTP